MKITTASELFKISKAAKAAAAEKAEREEEVRLKKAIEEVRAFLENEIYPSLHDNAEKGETKIAVTYSYSAHRMVCTHYSLNAEGSNHRAMTALKAVAAEDGFTVIQEPIGGTVQAVYLSWEQDEKDEEDEDSYF